MSVGVVVIDESLRSAPPGVKDSKLLRHWPAGGWFGRSSVGPAHAVGHASPAEIDEIGIMGGLRLAGMRALASVESTGLVPDLVILDGNHDWLTPRTRWGCWPSPRSSPTVPPVTTMIKADMKCSSVAAASVIAKVERDSMMVSLDAEHPQYGWAVNKGYAAPEHMLALEAHGPCVLHRRSWRLPGMPSLEELLEAGVVEPRRPGRAGYGRARPTARHIGGVT